MGKKAPYHLRRIQPHSVAQSCKRKNQRNAKALARRLDQEQRGKHRTSSGSQFVDLTPLFIESPL